MNTVDASRFLKALALCFCWTWKLFCLLLFLALMEMRIYIYMHMDLSEIQALNLFYAYEFSSQCSSIHY